jgi:hypothetical protein
MSFNGYLMECTFGVAFYTMVILGILSVAFPIPFYLWLLVLFVATPLGASAVMSIEVAYGETVANRIVQTGVVIALLVVDSKTRGQISWQVWTVVLALWLAFSAATVFFRREKPESEYVHNPDQATHE